MFSKACQYGIKATIYLAKQSLLDKKVSLKDVAKAIDSPEAYTSKVLQQLTRNTIINSGKGPGGGFYIDKVSLDNVKISTVVFALDGDSIYKGCGLGFKNCNENKPCSIHHKFKHIRDELKQMLEKTSLLDLSLDINRGKTFLKR